MQEKASRIKLLLLDVDGVLTSGQIIYDGTGNELKIFNVRDGHGLKMVQRVGIKVGIITGRKSDVVARRAAELGIDILHQGALDKMISYREILLQTGLSNEDIAYVGDDLIDLPVLRQVGFSATVADADEHVLNCVDYVSNFNGGCGAVREICDLLLKVGGHWDQVTARYFSDDQ